MTVRDDLHNIDQHTDGKRGRFLKPAWLWFGFLAGPVIWFVHLCVIYSIVDFGCNAGFSNLRAIDENTIFLLVLLATVPALLVTLAGGLISYKNWRDLDVEVTGPLADIAGKHRFITFIGIVMSGVFLVNIIVMVLPVFFVSPCGPFVG